MIKNKVCICGGGNLAHVTGGWLAARPDCEVRILTRSPQRWSNDGSFTVTDPHGKTFNAHFSIITDKAQEAIQGVDLVLLCLPGFAIASVLKSIAPYVDRDMKVGSIVSSTGYFLMADKLLPKSTQLFGFQRVPFIARINEFGKSASLLGYKPSLQVATKCIPDPESLSEILSDLFDMPVTILDDYMKVTLTNSNPLLHPSRLYALFSGHNKEFDAPVLFYEDWDDYSSQILIDCDNEFRQVLDRIGISEKDISPILTYYECRDAQSLTKKIRSIQAFKGLTAPMVQNANGKYVPDWNNRYFIEDIPYGLLIIKAFAEKNGVSTPTVDRILEWAQTFMNKQYIVNGKLIGNDISDTIVGYMDSSIRA